MPGKLDNPNPTPFIALEDVDPSRFCFAVLCRAEAVNAELLASLTAQQTTYRQFAALPGVENARVDEPAGDNKTLGDNWVFSHHQSGPGTLHTFNFVGTRTNLERQQPVTALSYVTSDVYPWPDVLKSLWFIEDPSMPIETVVNGKAVYLPRLFRRMNWDRGGSLPTLFRVQVFCSHQPFPESFFALDVPVPGGVWWDMRNSQGSIPECLHDYIEFPESQPQGRVFFGAGTVRQPFSFGQKTIFPATNHTDWRNHVCYEHVEQIRGVYMLERREALVPRGRKKLINLT
jgi:diadenosine tetraphosphatase ApaH/serine/threonine PP2A family protein phosphatase